MLGYILTEIEYQYITDMELRIKEVCNEKGITMSSLADKMNISKVTLSQSINGNPTVGTLQKIAGALGVKVVELFEASNAISNPDSQTPAVSLLDSVKEYAEKNKGSDSKHRKATALYLHLQRYNVDVKISQINKAYIDGFTEYLKTNTKLSNETVKTYIDVLKTVLYSTIDNFMTWAN